MAAAKQTLDPQKEIEILVNELEERVDRLRALYEQYFLGYEKLEPAVARKDVDRRFVHLRKGQIRNTALRFRFNVVTQKFNTYAMYWTRVCRQIEEGTFKRHIQKAKNRFGPGAGAATREQDFSIDVELGDFEEMMDEDGGVDVDKVLAEKPESDNTAPANAIQPEHDETAKSAIDVAPKSMRRPPPVTIEEHDTTPPPSVGGSQQHRVARQAVLPAGLKQRVLLKKAAPSSASGDAKTEPPPSDMTPPPTTAPSIRGRMPSVPDRAPPSEMTPAPMTAGVRGRMPSISDHGPPSTSVIRAASAANPGGPQGHVHRSPPGLNRPGISPNAQSVQRVAVAKPVERDTAPPPPPSVARPPVIQKAVPSQPGASVNRVPAAPPSQPSVNRVPVAAPSQPSVNRVPAAAPAPRQGSAPSFGRVPIGLPSGGSVARTPVSAGSIPPPAAQPPPPSERKLPVAMPSQQRPPIARPGGPMPAAAPVRPPAPSVPDIETKGPPSRRPPPMLPSQVKKP